MTRIDNNPSYSQGKLLCQSAWCYLATFFISLYYRTTCLCRPAPDIYDYPERVLEGKDLVSFKRLDIDNYPDQV